MFKIISDVVNIQDRYNLKVIPFKEEQKFDDAGYTRFIVCNGTFTSPNANFSGMFVGSFNKSFTVSGEGLVIELPGYLLLDEKFSFVNSQAPGNLSYIDGCSNSNLIDPPRNGDPCLNYLYFPEGIDQTFHTHPSLRIGMILEGTGYACLRNQEVPLNPGNIFVLDRFTLHRFRTTNSHMSLVAFHPDSEDGPRDEFNPMKSRTYIQ